MFSVEKAVLTWAAFFLGGIVAYLIGVWYVDMADVEIIVFWGVSAIRLFDGYLIGEMVVLVCL